MKKIFLSLVFLFGVGTFVMADDTMKVKNDTVAVEDGFKNIDLKEVPQSLSSTYKCNFFFFGRTIKAKIANFIHSE